jgi:hypothetical protein
MRGRYLDAATAPPPDRRTRDLIWECVALRHQLAVLERCQTRRPCFCPIDRLFWLFLSWWWQGWRGALTIIQADTVLRWRRYGIAAIWKYRSRGRWQGGRPRIPAETRGSDPRDGSREFSLERIHGELLKLGIAVSQATVSRYMPASRGGRRSQTWRTFVRNQATVIVCSRTIEGCGWINSIRFWLRAVRHGAPRFAAVALTAPRSWRPRYLAYTHGLIATHRRVRIARDVLLTVASIATIGRRLTPTKCKIDPLAAGRIRGPPRCARAQSASNRRHGSNGIRLACLAAGRSRGLQRCAAVTHVKSSDIGSPIGTKLCRVTI